MMQICISKLAWVKMALVPCASIEKMTNGPGGSPLQPANITVIILTRVRGIVTVV